MKPKGRSQVASSKDKTNTAFFDKKGILYRIARRNATLAALCGVQSCPTWLKIRNLTTTLSN